MSIASTRIEDYFLDTSRTYRSFPAIAAPEIAVYDDGDDGRAVGRGEVAGTKETWDDLGYCGLDEGGEGRGGPLVGFGAW